MDTAVSPSCREASYNYGVRFACIAGGAALCVATGAAIGAGAGFSEGIAIVALKALETLSYLIYLADYYHPQIVSGSLIILFSSITALAIAGAAKADHLANQILEIKMNNMSRLLGLDPAL